MPGGSGLTRSQAKRLDAASRSRVGGHAEVETEWCEAIAQLVDSGVAVMAVSKHLQVSRQAVYDWLERARTSS
jgi:transposase-like protein